MSPEQSVRGLTAEEVQDRQTRGLVNQTARTTSRSLAAILRGNFLTLFNGILAVSALFLLVVGQARDAFLITALIAFSVIVSTVQEIRAKLRLDQIALLARPRVRVIRGGEEVTIAPDEVVVDDWLLLTPGEQAVVDGVVTEADYLELDESLLTGEADPVPKRVGDKVFSGSFCLAGSGVYVAKHVGETSYIQSLTAAARRFRNVRTPTQRFVDRVLQVLLVVIVALVLFQALAFLNEGATLVEAARATAVIATLVPQGLLVMTTVAYTVGALQVARRGGLIQQLNAVDSMSHVDVLCTDKTGTITRNRIVFREIVPLVEPAGAAECMVGQYAASSPASNSTLQAIAEHVPGQPLPVVESVPFRSDRKWSGLTLAEAGATTSYVLGAPEVLLPNLGNGDGVGEAIEARAEAGQRVLLFARASGASPLRDPAGSPCLPPSLEPLALIVLEEDLRQDAQATLAAFRERGIQLKIISGDHPQTTLALARRAGAPASAVAVSGSELADLNQAELAEVVERTTVFGRVTPVQKQQIIHALKRNGHYTAMIGDGANDVMALKEAQLAIAMESGTAAARSVADMVLLKDDFATLPASLTEGQKIVSSMYLLVKLFLIRDVAMIGLIIFAGFLGLEFPLLPPHITILAFLTVGFPSLFLVAWARPEKPDENVWEVLGKFILPVGGVQAFAIVVVYALFALALDAGVAEARTAVVTAGLLSGLIVLLFLRHQLTAPLLEILRDWQLAVLVFAGLALYLFLFTSLAARRYFELANLNLANWLLIILIVGLSFGGLRLAVRYLASGDTDSE